MALKVDDSILLTKFSGNVEIFFGRGDVHDFEIVQSAVRPKLIVTLKDEDGDPVNMASGTATFSMVNWRDGSLIINAGSMSIDNGAAGIISYSWGDAGATGTVGTFLGRVTATPSGDSAHPIVEMIKVRIWPKFPTS